MKRCRIDVVRTGPLLRSACPRAK